MFNKLKQLFTKSVPAPVPAKKPRTPRKQKEAPVVAELSEKDRATAAGEPYIKVTQFEMDIKDIHTGNFTMDFNDKFVLNLIRAGYKMKDTDTDNDVVDRWFTQICRSIVMEQYEQEMADPANRGLDDVRPITKRNLGDGKVEVS